MVGFAIHSHESAMVVHVFTHEPLTHLPPHPIPQGHPSAPVLSTLSLEKKKTPELESRTLQVRKLTSKGKHNV